MNQQHPEVEYKDWEPEEVGMDCQCQSDNRLEGMNLAVKRRETQQGGIGSDKQLCFRK